MIRSQESNEAQAVERGFASADGGSSADLSDRPSSLHFATNRRRLHPQARRRRSSAPPSGRGVDSARAATIESSSLIRYKRRMSSTRNDLLTSWMNTISPVAFSRPFDQRPRYLGVASDDRCVLEGSGRRFRRAVRVSRLAAIVDDYHFTAVSGQIGQCVQYPLNVYRDSILRIAHRQNH